MSNTRLAEPTIAEVLAINRGDKVAFFGMHPDDLSVFYSGAISLAQSLEAEVHLITATDGEKSTIGDHDFVVNKRRRYEALAEAAILGVSSENQHYLGLPDLSDYNEPEMKAKLNERIRDVLSFILPKVIFTPGEFGVDGNKAHSAGHEEVVAARDALGLDARVWGNAAEADSTFGIPVEPELKFRALAANYSQFPSIIDGKGNIMFMRSAIDRLMPYVFNGLFEVEYYVPY